MSRSVLGVVLIFVVLIPSAVFAEWGNGIWLVGFGGVTSIVPDETGGVILVANTADIRAQRISGNGAIMWGGTEGVGVCLATGNQLAPVAISDGTGGIIVAWRDDRGPNADIYAQRIDASGTALWTADGVPLCTAADEQLVPSIASDGAGGAIVTWYDKRDPTIPRDYDIYAQRIDASGAVQWAANGVVITARGQDQWYPKIIADGAGGAIITFYDRNTVGAQYDIYAQRVNASGVVQWGAIGLPVCSAANGQIDPMIISDGAGGAIITWVDFRAGNNDIYAQRIDGTGASLWTANGVALCTAVNSQNWNGGSGFPFATHICPDMSGGAIVTWADRRNGGVDDIYAQRVDASGNVQWTADGVAICTAMNGQTFPTIASDGNGGAIIAWFDARPDADRNYAQRIDASGVVQWAADGVLVPMPSASSQAVIMGDGLGGAFLAHGSIQRIGPGGSVPTGIGDTPSVSAVALDPNYPNPFSAWTRMNIELAVESEVEVDVFDVAGRKVRELRPGRLGAGAGTIQFDGRDAMGRALPSGVYFYRVTAAGAVTTQKMVIAR